MSSIGLDFSSTNRIPSQAKMNVKTNLVGTGDEILAASMQDPRDIGKLALCKADSTGGALKAFHIYMWLGNSLGWVIKSQSVHTHEDSNTGGAFQDVILKAIKNLYYVNLLNPHIEDFTNSGTGGVYTDKLSGSDGYVELSTGTTANNSANAIVVGSIPTFTKVIKFNCRTKLSSVTSNFGARIGVGSEYSHQVTDNLNKFGFEGCDACNGTNIQIFSSNGTRSKLNTSNPVNTLANYAVENNPVDDKIYFYRNNDVVIQKTTDVPKTGVPIRSNSFVAGIQTTTTVNAILDFYFANISGTLGEVNLP